MLGRFGLLLATASLSLGACANQGVGVAAAGTTVPFFDTASCWNDGWSGLNQLPYCGWYDGLFYPGSGVYVYDHDHHPHVWSDGQKDYWSQRREQWHGQSTTGARGALGIVGGRTASRPVMPREMGMGMPGFSGRFEGAMPRASMSARPR